MPVDVVERPRDRKTPRPLVSNPLRRLPVQQVHSGPPVSLTRRLALTARARRAWSARVPGARARGARPSSALTCTRRSHRSRAPSSRRPPARAPTCPREGPTPNFGGGAARHCFIFLETPDEADPPACGGGPPDFFLYATPVAEPQGLKSLSATAHSRCTSPGRRLPGGRPGARRPADRSPGSGVEVGTSRCAESVHHPCLHFGDANRIAARGAPPTSRPDRLPLGEVQHPVRPIRCRQKR